MKRIIAALLVLAFVAALLPAPAMAGGAGTALAAGVIGGIFGAVLAQGDTTVVYESRTVHHSPRFTPPHRHWHSNQPGAVVEYHPFGYRPGPWVYQEGYWDIRSVPVSRVQNVLVVDTEVGGQWTSGHLEPREVTMYVTQRIWVPGKWVYTGPLYR